MSYIVFDVVRRYLEFRGFQGAATCRTSPISTTRSSTRAQEAERHGGELAEKFIAQFFATWTRLNVQRAHVYPRATEEIPEDHRGHPGSLSSKGHAYEATGDVYFRVSKPRTTAS